MLSSLQTWGYALREGASLIRTQKKDLSALYKKHPTKLAFVGMGGSGIAGRITKRLLGYNYSFSIEIIDQPIVPLTVDEHTLVIAISYSGNTWETLEALEQLVARGVPALVLSSGGEALVHATQAGLPCVVVPEGVVPRAALPHFMGVILAVLDELELYDGYEVIDSWVNHWKSVVGTMNKASSYEPFLQFIGEKHFFHIWGVSGDTDAVAYRAQTQFNENSKVAAVCSLIPELHHNLLVGFTHDRGRDPILLLATDFCVPSLQKAVGSLQDVLKERGCPLYKPRLLGDTWTSQFAYGLWWADYASYYLGCMRGEDIGQTVLIDKLKQEYSRKVSSV